MYLSSLFFIVSFRAVMILFSRKILLIEKLSHIRGLYGINYYFTHGFYYSEKGETRDWDSRVLRIKAYAAPGNAPSITWPWKHCKCNLGGPRAWKPEWAWKSPPLEWMENHWHCRFWKSFEALALKLHFGWLKIVTGAPDLQHWLRDWCMLMMSWISDKKDMRIWVEYLKVLVIFWTFLDESGVTYLLGSSRIIDLST